MAGCIMSALQLNGICFHCVCMNFCSGVVDYVVSGSGARMNGPNSGSAMANLRNKNIKSTFDARSFGFAGFILEGNQISVHYIDHRGKEIYKITKQNPRK